LKRVIVPRKEKIIDVEISLQKRNDFNISYVDKKFIIIVYYQLIGCENVLYL